MKQFLRIYGTCIKTSLSRAAAYRMNFLLSVTITLLGNVLFPIVTILIYQGGASFPGWTFYEVLLMQAIYTLSNGLTSMVFESILWVTMDHIRNGNFEIILLKPVRPLEYLIGTNFAFENVGMVVGGTLLYVIAIRHVEKLSITMFLCSGLLFMAGILVMVGFQLIMAATSFKWVGNSRIPEIFNSIKTFGQYPMTIFPMSIRTLATFLIPVGMVGFYPAAALLGRLSFYHWFAILPCILFLLFGIWIYHVMIKSYEGVGG